MCKGRKIIAGFVAFVFLLATAFMVIDAGTALAGNARYHWRCKKCGTEVYMDRPASGWPCSKGGSCDWERKDY